MEVVLELEAPVGVETAAAVVRERLVGFVGEVTRWLPLARQRENAGLYVRGLIEDGRRKSLQPTLFRLGEDGARYESMQQFLADSPWDPVLLVRACAERVAPEIGVEAWVLDDTGFPKDGRRSPGGEAAVLGDAGEDRELPDRCVGARGRVEGDGPAGLGAVSAGGLVRRQRAPSEGEDP